MVVSLLVACSLRFRTFLFFMRFEQDIPWFISSVLSLLNYSTVPLIQYPQHWTGAKLSSILYYNMVPKFCMQLSGNIHLSFILISS